ncbi:diguanylate cyclase domain-containing protein [Pelomonas nitida]|uniref:Diguanylate cyclase domain-containing protein n=1 Tax=Pelomonas nitida TaxID=3299027 RepID=A0ABW7G295_9BURK
MTPSTAPRVRGVHSLQIRFMLLVVASATLLALAAATIAYQLGQARALANSRSSVEALAAAVEKTVSIGVYAEDEVLLHEVTSGLASNELVDVVEVLSADGRAIAKGLRQGAREDTGATLLTRPVVSPFDAREVVGQLRIRLNDAKVRADANQEAYTLAAAMAGQAALLALVLYLLAARMVSGPIVRLADALRRMKPGAAERLQTPPRHVADEIGVLISGANALLEANETALRNERRLRAEVEAMEARYRQIFDASSAGIFVLDGIGRLINGNPTMSRVVGVPMAALRELGEQDFVAAVFNRPELVRQMMADAAARGETVSADLELVPLGEARRWVHCLISVPRDGGNTVEGVIYDITERKSDENAVRHRAEHDGLTSLKNRDAGLAVLARFVADARTRRAVLTVACIDLDGFKQINDTHGHAAGDAVLVACAERMRAAVRRASDLVARLGGDEFLVALRDVGPGDGVLSQVMQALLEGLAQPVRLASGVEVRVGVSIGVACAPLHGSDPLQLMHAADEALYHVKRNGKLAFALALPALASSTPA